MHRTSQFASRISRFQPFSLAIMLGLIVVFCKVEAWGQVTVDGATTGQTIRGYANRAAYTGRHSPSVGYTGVVATPVQMTARPAVASTEAHLPSGILVAQQAVYEQTYGVSEDADTDSRSNLSLTPSRPVSSAPTLAVAFSIEPWHRMRYRVRHPQRYYDDLYYKRTHSRHSSYGYYGSYGYGYGYGYYRPYSYYRSGYRTYGTYRSGNYFDGYRYRRQHVRVNTPSLQQAYSANRGHGGYYGSGFSLHLRF